MRFFVLSAITFFGNALAFAQGTAPAAGGGAAAAGGAQGGNPPGLQNLIIMIGAIMFLFYFIILRPQKTEQRKHEELLNSVTKGDAVVTSAGIFGTVESVDSTKGIVTVAVAPKVSIKFARNAITQVTKKKDNKDSEGEAANG